MTNTTNTCQCQYMVVNMFVRSNHRFVSITIGDLIPEILSFLHILSLQFRLLRWQCFGVQGALLQVFFVASFSVKADLQMHIVFIHGLMHIYFFKMTCVLDGSQAIGSKKHVCQCHTRGLIL